MTEIRLNSPDRIMFEDLDVGEIFLWGPAMAPHIKTIPTPLEDGIVFNSVALRTGGLCNTAAMELVIPVREMEIKA